MAHTQSRVQVDPATVKVGDVVFRGNGKTAYVVLHVTRRSEVGVDETSIGIATTTEPTQWLPGRSGRAVSFTKEI